MSAWRRAATAAGLVALLALAAGPAHAGRGILEITVGDTPDPAPTEGQVAYSIAVKNTGTIKANNVSVTVPLPPGTTFVKCSTSPSKVCAPAAGVVSVAFGSVKAHVTVKVNLTLAMPAVSVETTLPFDVSADGDEVDDNDLSTTTTVLPAAVTATYLPSLRQVTVACGDTVGGDGFGADTTLQFEGGLGCATSAVGLRMAASGKTLSLNKFKIVGSSVGAVAKGSAGIVIAAGATDVTIDGRSTNGKSGIEYFDRCVVDEGGNSGLTLSKLRCFRARTAGVDLISNQVSLVGVLVDKATGTTTTTLEPPGGVGVQVAGDNVTIHNTVIRRSQRIGLWVMGVDADADGNGVSVTGNTSTSKVENNLGTGILAEGERLQVKDTLVSGDGAGGVSQTGIAIEATAVGTVLDGVQVRRWGGGGVVDAGTGTQILRSRVEDLALDGIVSTGAGAYLANNEVRAQGHAYVLAGPDAVASTNLAEGPGGDGFILSGDRAALDNNTAKGGAGHGFVVRSATAVMHTNAAETNVGDGFRVEATGGTYVNNRAKKNGGVGFQVQGTSNGFKTNTSELSGGWEWVLGPNNINNQGNRANGTRFWFGSKGGTFK